MAIVSIPTMATGDTIEASWGNDLRDNILVLDGRTGGDPGAANRWPVSTSSTASTWVARATEVVNAIGYTPANKAGETFTGLVTMSSLGLRIPGTQNWTIFVTGGTSLALQNATTGRYLLIPNTGSLLVDGLHTLWASNNGGAGSGLDADTVDGLQAAQFAATDRGVPSGAVVWFGTAAELAAAGAAWALCDGTGGTPDLRGRGLVGAGTTFSQTFVQATNYGASWTPSITLSATSAAIAVPDVGAGIINYTIGGTPVNLATGIHTHAAPAITLNGIAGIWIPPSRAGVWGRKT